MRKRLLLLVFALLSFVSLSITAGAAGTSAQIVTCPGFAGCFSPNPIRITTGTSVTWTNNTGLTHTATSDSGAWDTGSIGSGQTSGSITFNAAGTFPYHCTIHPSMQGTIIVTAAVTTTPRATAAPTTAPRTLAAGGAGPAPLLGLLALMLGLLLFATGYGRSTRRRT